MTVRNHLAHGAGQAAGALAHPKHTAARVLGLVRGTAGVGTQVVRRAAATAVGTAADLTGAGRHGGSRSDYIADAGPSGATSGVATPGGATPDPAPPLPDPEPVPPSAPRFAEPPVDEGEPALRTPSGIPAADQATNPNTTEADLHQPDTAPLMDPATVKAIKAETDTLRKAATRRKP